MSRFVAAIGTRPEGTAVASTKKSFEGSGAVGVVVPWGFLEG